MYPCINLSIYLPEPQVIISSWVLIIMHQVTIMELGDHVQLILLLLLLLLLMHLYIIYDMYVIYRQIQNKHNLTHTDLLTHLSTLPILLLT